jgi:hypothetical protein
MAGLAIKNLPPHLHRRLKAAAARNRRSMAQQLIVLLEEALDRTDRAVPGDPPEPIDPVTVHDSRWVYRAIREGRR